MEPSKGLAYVAYTQTDALFSYPEFAFRSEIAQASKASVC
jgi:hypothetical protein